MHVVLVNHNFECIQSYYYRDLISFIHSSPLGCVGDYGQDPGVGLLRLHSTYRHDLKIYASDEGRVQMTAAAFAKVSFMVTGCLFNKSYYPYHFSN